LNVRRRLSSAPLQRRLQLAYLGTFAVVIMAFALVVRISFGAALDNQEVERLSTLARAGTAAVYLTRDSFNVDENSLGGFSVREHAEGLEWFDVHRHLVDARGLVPHAAVPPELGLNVIGSAGNALNTYTIPLEDRRGVLRGYVRAGESVDVTLDSRKALDIGLAAGALLAILAAALGGSLLARNAVAQTEASLTRLREFTADAAHELRSPLMALASTASVALREEPTMPATTRARLATIIELSAQMRRLADDLLILARAGQSIEHELFVIDVPSLLERIEKRFREVAAAKQVALEFTPCQRLQLYGNPEQVERIVANLLENAIRYTDPNGRVAIACVAETSHVRISVRDSGIGIASEHLERVFERFWRADATRRSETGTGLGLAIARALARRHGGEITVSSQPRGGSEFVLSLPLQPPPFA
jgi:two-component system, OmpR family, manganese sensing sensor histidine kinase